MSKALTLIDLEDFLPVLQLDGDQNGIKDDDFIQKQYAYFMQITSLNTALDYREHSKLQKFKSFVLKDTEDYKKNKIRRNYLFNLIYNKYMFDIQSIKSQNVFNNFYFSNAENGVIKQFFVAAIQVLFTILLLLEIIQNFEDIDFDNDFNLSLAIIVTYLSFVLIKPSISSIVGDLKILGTYFTLAPLNTILNITANIVLASLLPWVTFFVILNSETMTDIVLNATAIAFIIELDDDAADEVDLENWFVSSTTSFEDIFKKVIEFNHPIITYDDDGSEKMRNQIEEEINKIQDALKDKNTKLEYFESDICGKFKHMMKNIAVFILTPILIYEHPLNIMVDICRRILNRKDVENNARVASKQKDIDVKAKEEEPNAGRTVSGTSTMTRNVEEEKAPLNALEHAQIMCADAVQQPRNTINYSERDLEQIAKAVKLNEEGNNAVNEHKYNEAHRKYTEGIKLLIGYYKKKDEDLDECKYNEEHEDIFDLKIFPFHNVILLRVISILYFNNGFALYRRAKQSWISEIVTNENGHPFTNYNNALRYCVACIPFLSSNRSGNKLRAMYHKLVSEIYYDLYQFEESEQNYIRYINILKLKPNDKKLLQIQQRKSEDHAPYLKILDNARKHISSSCSHTQDECPFKHMVLIFENLKYKQSFTEIGALIGKFHWFCSEYHVMKIRRLSDAQKELKQEIEALERAINTIDKYKLKDKMDKSKIEPNKLELQSQINDCNREIQLLTTKKKEFTHKRVAEAQKAQQIDDLYRWSLFNTDINSADSKQLGADIIATFTNSIEFEPHQPYYYFIRGSVYYQMQRYMDALHDLQKAQELNDANPLFTLKRACCIAKTKGQKSFKSDTFVHKMAASLMQQSITLPSNIRAGLLSAYYDEAFKDDEEGMNANGYQLFLAHLSKRTREIFKMHASFDDLCDDDGLIQLNGFQAITDKIIPVLIRDDEYIDECDVINDDFVYNFLSYLQHDQESQKHLDHSEVDPSVHINDYNNRYLQTTERQRFIQHSRDELFDIMDNGKFGDDGEGLTEGEWTRFVNMLTDNYQRVLKEHSINFEKYADADGIMGFKEFIVILEKLAEIYVCSLFH